MIWVVLFWAALCGLFYIYGGYPLLVALLARVMPRPVGKGPFGGTVSILIAVHNEAAKLAPKLQSLLESEAASRIVEILVGSDGSTDDVASAVAAAGDARVKLKAFPTRRGKPAVLNDLMPSCQGGIVVMTDARQPAERHALGALLENFADERVGVVSGELVFRTGDKDSTAARGVDAYWRYEKFIRKNESRFRSVPGATGALYAIRRDLLAPIPAQTVLDDVAIPLQAALRGFRCVFEDGAVVYDTPSQSSGQEAIRKRRTIAGNAQLVALYPALLAPWRNPIWFEFVSHKLLRLVSPFLLVLMAVANVFLLGDPFFRPVMMLQASFYLLAVLGGVLQAAGLRLGLLGVPLMFCSLNWATLLAVIDAARGRFDVTWRRSAA